jgi:hypothetical protein
MSTKSCGFGLNGGLCYACELEDRKKHQEGCLCRWEVAKTCTCIERADKESTK